MILANLLFRRTRTFVPLVPCLLNALGDIIVFIQLTMNSLYIFAESAFSVFPKETLGRLLGMLRA